MKAVFYGLTMLAVGLSIGTYQSQLELKTVIRDMPVVAEQRVVSLPEDGKAYYTSLFLPKNWQNDQKSRELRSWFDTNITLSSLKAQTHFNVVTPADPQWKAKYEKSVGSNLPCFALTDATGTVVCKRTSPTDVNSLASEVTDACRRGRRCPVKPEPTPEPEPVIPDTGPVLPNSPVLPDSKPLADEFPLWLGILLALGGVAAAVVPDVISKYKAMS